MARRKALNPRKQPSQGRSRFTLRQIVEAAARVFEERGYAGTTTNRIAERAGVSIGSLYQYFPNKESILVVLLEQHTQEVADAVEAFKRELSKVRTGRANLSLLDGVKVEYYGTPTPLNQVATLNIADARLITVKPWEKNLIPVIEKAIRVSDLGLNPVADSEIQELIAAITADSGSMASLLGTFSPDRAQALRDHEFDRKALGERGMPYEALDQLTNELLLGVR